MFGKRLKGVKLDNIAKRTSGMAVIPMPLPEAVYIPLAQSAGAPCRPMVALGDFVKVGQIVADSAEWVSAPVHASVSGEVVSLEDGCIVIASDGTQEVWQDVRPPRIESRADFLAAVRASGVVGLGGDAFPLAVKFAAGEGTIDTLIVNGAECDAYSTSDYQAMLAHGADIVSGIKSCLTWLGIRRGIIGVGADKSDAISRLAELVREEAGIEVAALNSVFPIGAEQIICRELTGRYIPEGCRPMDRGVLVCNVSTILKLAQYLTTGMPLVSRSVTVDGDAVARPQNLEVPIGTRIADILDFCGLSEEPGKIILGGPMTGKAVVSADVPLTKAVGCILCTGRVFAGALRETACISCGACIDCCPVDLMPNMLIRAFTRKKAAMLQEYNLGSCIGCGCCSYVCPARIDIVGRLRDAKTFLEKEKEAAAYGR